MGKNKGRHGSDYGHQKASNLLSFVRAEEQRAKALLASSTSSSASSLLQTALTKSRPLLDITRFRSLLDSHTDTTGAQIVTNAPFSDEFLQQYKYRKAREEARKTDEAHYSLVEKQILLRQGHDSTKQTQPSQLQLLCLPIVARFHSRAIAGTYFLASLTPLQQHLILLNLCRSRKLTPGHLECLAQCGPCDTLVCNDAIDDRELLQTIHLNTAEPLPALGAFHESWEAIDWDWEVATLALKSQPLFRPLYTQLLYLHLVGCTLSVPAIREVGYVCSSLTTLSIHRLTIAGVPGHTVDWNDTLTAIFIPAYRNSLWLTRKADNDGVDGDKDGGDWAAEADSSASLDGLKLDVAVFPSLSNLVISHCWEGSRSQPILQSFALNLFLSRKTNHGGLTALTALSVTPCLAGQISSLRSQFGASGIEVDDF